MEKLRIFALLLATSLWGWLLVSCGGSNAVPAPTPVQITQQDCLPCHPDVHDQWLESSHAATQEDVAGELAEERAGQTPDEVIHGGDAEDCIACHGPTGILSNGGMTETAALSYYFSVENGTFSGATTAMHTSDWPDVTCTTCHDVPSNHTTMPSLGTPTLALFDSQTGSYVPANSTALLCGQCHGDLHFSDTDHRTYNAWATSKHSNTQEDVASELAAERSGQTPEEVIQGSDPENCIACHAPTAVLANGKMSETKALGYFFTTEDGKFSATTTVANASEWPSVSCSACHNEMSPGMTPNPSYSYFNSSTRTYEPMDTTAKLCGQCHGNLRFPDTDHKSYNIETGTGGTNVPDQLTMPGVTCTDCHMFVSAVDGSNSSMFHGHSFKINVKEEIGSTTSCTQCHSTFNVSAADTIIASFQSSFATLDATTQSNVAAAATAMAGNNDPLLLAKLGEAQDNLEYAESDESSGFHNHNYLMSLLNDANDRATEILTALGL